MFIFFSKKEPNDIPRKGLRGKQGFFGNFLKNIEISALKERGCYPFLVDIYRKNLQHVAGVLFQISSHLLQLIPATFLYPEARPVAMLTSCGLGNITSF